MVRIISKSGLGNLSDTLQLGILITGEPIPTSCRVEVTENGLPLDELTNEESFRTNLMPKLIENALDELISQSRNEYFLQHRECLLQHYNIPTRPHISASQNEHTGTEFVIYRMAVQFYHPQLGTHIGITRKKPYVYDQGKNGIVGLDKNPPGSELASMKGEVIINLISAETDITDYFESLRQVSEFDSRLDENPGAEELFERYLKERLLKNIAVLNEKKEVRLILLSDLKVKAWSTRYRLDVAYPDQSQQLSYAFTSEVMEPKGDIMIAATYFF